MSNRIKERVEQAIQPVPTLEQILNQTSGILNPDIWGPKRAQLVEEIIRGQLQNTWSSFQKDNNFLESYLVGREHLIKDILRAMGDDQALKKYVGLLSNLLELDDYESAVRYSALKSNPISHWWQKILK